MVPCFPVSFTEAWLQLKAFSPCLPPAFPPFSPFPTPTHEEGAPEELRVLSVLAGPV